MFVKRLLLIISVFTALLYVAASLAPYLNPQSWWPFSILAIGFPLLLVLMLVLTLLWFIVDRRYGIAFLLLLLVGYKSISVFFAIGSNKSFALAKKPGTLRVLNWNVARFIEWKRNNNKGSQKRLRMLAQIKKYNADVLCLQEFFTSTDSVYYNNLEVVKKELGYPYHHFSSDNDGWLQYNGEIILSRYPIVAGSMLRYPRPLMPDALIKADIAVGKDTVRFITTHLQSVRFSRSEYEDLEQIKRREDGAVQASKNILAKLKRGFVLRSQQVHLAKSHISASPYPSVLTGDFNDIPNSYTYAQMRGERKDAFLESGFAVGRTYSGISPTLRIDYILPSKHFEVLQFKREVQDLSDHYMLVTDLRLRR